MVEVRGTIGLSRAQPEPVQVLPKALLTTITRVQDPGNHSQLRLRDPWFVGVGEASFVGALDRTSTQTLEKSSGFGGIEPLKKGDFSH